ncbi:T3SS effector HopA1 family protein [Streptomyces sp. NPDC006283]|uniref:T3SS effector HopA1 family protein n=1 Tax=Streptomyces sp. NPDC006283 TaxID=3156741 RepID=UPI0033A4FB2A
MTAITVAPALPDRLVRALKDVHVSADGTEARLGTRTVTSDNPREMRRLLAEALYDVLHAGQDVDKKDLPLNLRDEGFEKELAAVVPHRGTTTRVRALDAGEHAPAGSGPLLVERDGVRVWVPRDQVVDGDPAVAGSILTLRVAALRPALSPGFFMVDGSRPRPRGNRTLRVYVHVTAAHHAAPVWGRVLSRLEGEGVPYRSKALSARGLYPRRDALVVYLTGDAADAAGAVADAVRGAEGVGAKTSVFTSELAPGVSVAEEPDDPRPAMSGLSFGQHRATATAHALLGAARGEGPLPSLLAEALREAGADPADPYRNLPRTV